MTALKGAPEFFLASAKAAGQPASVGHVPGAAVLWMAVIGLAAVACLAYRVSLWLHPFRLCRRCGGSGKVRGFLPWSWSVCGWCDRGLAPRLGTRLISARGRGSR